MFEYRTSLAGDASAKGKIVYAKESDVPVTAFLGIPYARPPVGDLRFCPPRPQELWTGERDCTKFGNMSVQPLEAAKMVHEFMDYPDVMSEDSLYLNVYTPNLKSDARLPVMVWFYGGGFYVGTSDVYDGTALAAFNDVIVVTVNYRLGIFGFFTTGDDVIPGNNGLLDQVEALKWVQKHITSFGGDPDNVTIFGESAGGMSCSMHVLSDLTVGLFRRAIIQSGAATSPFSVTTQQMARESLQPNLEKMGYTGKSSEDLVAFLRTKPAEELAVLEPLFVLFKPVIDGHYMKDYPHNLYAQGKFQDVDIITGCCSSEGYSSVKFFLSSPDITFKQDDLPKHVKNTIQMYYPENLDAITDALCGLYITPDAVDNADRFKQQYVDLVGDVTFLGPQQLMALKHAGKGGLRVFIYMFDHRSPFSEDQPSWAKADHGSDVIPSFGMPFTESTHGQTFTECDKKLSKTFMAYVTNFAKTGDPNGPGLTKWEKFSCDDQSYLVLREQPQMHRNYQPEKMEFFLTKLPNLDSARSYKLGLE